MVFLILIAEVGCSSTHKPCKPLQGAGSTGPEEGKLGPRRVFGLRVVVHRRRERPRPIQVDVVCPR